MPTGKIKSHSKVVPANLVDLEMVKDHIRKTLKNLLNSYQMELSDTAAKDFDHLALNLMGHLEKKQKEAAQKVTKQEAYDKAIQIMSDVGIKDPEKRFNQYPHEFSGGMRQRIVIAIAITANPEILISLKSGI